MFDSRYCFFWKIFSKIMLARYRGINNKGVLDRPWTIWKVLRAISSTLKCQFTGNHENEKIWLFGETEHRRPGVYKDAQRVSAHFCLAKTPSIAIWGQQIKCSMKTRFFKFSLLRYLGVIRIASPKNHPLTTRAPIWSCAITSVRPPLTDSHHQQ